MKKDYAAIASRVQPLIERLGAELTVTRSTVASFDPSLGYTVPGADLVATGSGVMDSYKSRDIDGTVIRRGDMEIYIGPELAFEPAVNDTVTVDSVTWNIVNVEQVSPAGTDCLYICHVRR